MKTAPCSILSKVRPGTCFPLIFFDYAFYQERFLFLEPEQLVWVNLPRLCDSHRFFVIGDRRLLPLCLRISVATDAVVQTVHDILSFSTL
jgi:hypothetical protein